MRCGFLQAAQLSGGGLLLWAEDDEAQNIVMTREAEAGRWTDLNPMGQMHQSLHDIQTPLKNFVAGSTMVAEEEGPKLMETVLFGRTGRQILQYRTKA